MVVVSAGASHLKRLLHMVQQEVQHLVSFVVCRLHCIAKLMMLIYVENVTNGFMKPIFWPLGTFGAFSAAHATTSQEDTSLVPH